MKFDVLSAFTGFVIAFVIIFVWRRFKNTSFYDVPTFQGMSLQAASDLYEKTMQEMSNDLQTRSEALIAAGNPAGAKKLGLEMQKMSQDLALAYNTYTVDLVPSGSMSPALPSIALSPGSSPSPSPST